MDLDDCTTKHNNYKKIGAIELCNNHYSLRVLLIHDVKINPSATLKRKEKSENEDEDKGNT